MERAWLLFNRVNCEIRLWKRAKVPSARMGIALNMLMEIVEPWQDSLLCGEIIPPPRIEVNRLLKAFDEVKVTIGREDIWLRSILGDIIGDYQSYCAILEQERVVREEIERRMKEKKEEPDEDEDEEEEEVGSDLSSHSFKEKEEIIMPSRTHECVTIVDSDEEEEEGEDEDDEEEEVKEVKEEAPQPKNITIGTPIVGSSKTRRPPALKRTIRTKTIVWHCLPPSKKKKY